MFRIVRIIAIFLIAIAAWLAVVGIVRKSTRHLFASIAILFIVAASFPIVTWFDQQVPIDLPPGIDAEVFVTESRKTLDHVQVSAFDKVANCLRHLKALTRFYERYPQLYAKQHAVGQALTRTWTDFKLTASNQRRLCVDETDLHQFLVQGQAELKRLNRLD